MTRRNFGASRIMALLTGVYCGWLGLLHGYPEILQGNVRPDGLLIRAFGVPCQVETSPVGCEPAMTVIPSFLITGILAIALLLVGGGFTPIPFGIFAGLAAAGIKLSPAGWSLPAWHLPAVLRDVLAKLWPWTLLTSVMWYLGRDQLEQFFTLSSTTLDRSLCNRCSRSTGKEGVLNV